MQLAAFILGSRVMYEREHLLEKVLTSTNASNGNGQILIIALLYQDSENELLRNRRKPLKGSPGDIRLIETYQ